MGRKRILNIEGLEADRLHPANKLKLAKGVAWKRQARAYARLRQLIDDRYLATLKVRDIEPLKLPQRLQGWSKEHSMTVERIWPDLAAAAIVRKIEALAKEREMMRQDNTYIPQPGAVGARRMERIRLRHHYAQLNPANRKNFDLIGL